MFFVFFCIGFCIAFQCGDFTSAAAVNFLKPKPTFTIIALQHIVYYNLLLGFLQCVANSDQKSDDNCFCVWEPTDSVPLTTPSNELIRSVVFCCLTSQKKKSKNLKNQKPFVFSIEQFCINDILNHLVCWYLIVFISTKRFTTKNRSTELCWRDLCGLFVITGSRRAGCETTRYCLN